MDLQRTRARARIQESSRKSSAPLWTVAFIFCFSVIAVPAYALFTEASTATGNTFSTATLEPATALSAQALCGDDQTPGIILSWTATPSGFADGYDIHRGIQGAEQYDKVASVSGRTSTTFSEGLLAPDTTYLYFVVATGRNWSSVQTTPVEATTSAECP